jgi:hydrogenase nickel incorporation protein HypA/HybF
VHELYIAESILKSSRSSLPPDVQPEAVREIHVDCGKLDAVIPDTLAFLFDAIKENYCFTNAELRIHEIPVECFCRECKQTFALSSPLFRCPNCKSSDINVVQGRGIKLTRLVADD